MITNACEQITHDTHSGDFHVRIQLRPRHQYKRSVSDMRVRERQVGLTRLMVGVAEQIKIERTRPPARAVTTSPLFPLDRQQRIKQGARFERGLQLSDCVDEGWLIGNAPRRTSVKARVAQQAHAWKVAEREQRTLQLSSGIVEITAEPDPCAYIGALNHHFRWCARPYLAPPWACGDACARVFAEPVSRHPSL